MTEALQATPSATDGTGITRFNALQHGVLSRYTVLPWESAAEYQAILDALAAEYEPRGATEEHLVEELAGVLWRKRRLRLAEAAAYHRGLRGTLSRHNNTVKAALAHLGVNEQIETVAEAIQATAETTASELAYWTQEQAKTARARDQLADNKPNAYGTALAALRDDIRDWWKRALDPEQLDEGEEPYTADGAGLRRFLVEKVLPRYATLRTEVENRPLIRAQAYGEALEPDKLERLARYEVHLDRKLERALALLLRLQDLRQGPVEA